MPKRAEKSERYTYADVLCWPGDERWELHEGLAVSMSPAPTTLHQRVVGELHRQISNFLVDGPCEVFVAPFDVRLGPADAAPEAIDTVLQPDLTVICDESGLDERGYQGAPDWIIEVLSPSTAARDQITKLRYYETHGVRHYWLVHPIEHVVTIYSRSDPTHAFDRPQISETQGQLASGLFDDLMIDWDRVPR